MFVLALRALVLANCAFWTFIFVYTQFNASLIAIFLIECMQIYVNILYMSANIVFYNSILFYSKKQYNLPYSVEAVLDSFVVSL